MTTRTDPGEQRPDEARESEPHRDEQTDDRDAPTGSRDPGDTELARGDGDAPPADGPVTVADGGTTTTVDRGPTDAFVTAGDRDADDVPEDAAGSGGGLPPFATVDGGPQDHLGMSVEPDLRRVDLPGHATTTDAGGMIGGAVADLPAVGHDPVGFDRGSVISSPLDDLRDVADQGEVLTPPGMPEGDRGTLLDHPNLVGDDPLELAAEAADPDLTHLVDMDAIIGGQVGGTIDGRTPDGGMGGHTSGFAATTGWQGGDPLAGAAGLTDADAAADMVQRGIETYGHGGFSVYDAYTGKAVYGLGVSNGTAPPIPAKSGAEGEYILVKKGDQYTASSSSPLSTPVTTGESGVAATGSGSVHADKPFFQKLAAWVMQGSDDSTKAQALQQATDEIARNDGAAPPEEPERPDDGPETELPADPDAGGAPPMGLDLSQDWAIDVWARQNADINPNPMGDGLVAGSVQDVDLSGMVEQYDEPHVAPNVDADAALQRHRDSIEEQFTEHDA